jgi:hypothetical protein
MRTILSDSPQQHEERRKAGLELFQKLSSTSAVTANLKTLLHQIDALPPLPA